MTEEDKKQLRLEIEHIFSSGANEYRIFEMVEAFIDKRYKPAHKVTQRIHNGCTYWYEVVMHADREGNGVHIPTKIRLPVACVSARGHASTIQYLNPSSASIELLDVPNEKLLDSPYVKA